MTAPETKPRRFLRRRADVETRAGVRLSVVLSLLALAGTAVATVVGLVSLDAALDGTNADLADVRRSELATCRRVQVLRDQSNREARVIFLTLDGAARSARSRGSRRFADFYTALADTVTFTPPTDCRRAVAAPGIYEPPAPIRFADCRRPPSRDFRGCRTR